jgi:FkbM family methyltransferase
MNQPQLPLPSSQSFKTLTNEAVRIKVVDIGANPINELPPYSGLLKAGDADVVGFEPAPEGLAKLNEIKGPNETYLPYAIGDGGRHTLHICRAPGMTSLLKPNLDVLNMFHGFPGWATVLSTEEVDTVKLDDIAETAGVELIKMDIQGAELMVLRNAKKRLKSTLVLQVEVEFLKMYEDQPLFSEIEQFLRKQHFVFHRFFPLVSRTIQPMMVGGDQYAGLSQSLWADAIFVRDFTDLKRLSPDQILKTAAIMHDCYQSFDLVLNLLQEYDKRTGKSVAPTYLPALKKSAGA